MSAKVFAHDSVRTLDDFEHNALQLAQELRTMPGVSRCMVQQVFRYTFGRSETPVDNCALEQLAQRFQDGHYNFQQLLVAFVRSDAFRFRPRADGTMGGGM